MGLLNDLLIVIWESVGPAVIISQGLKLFWALVGIFCIWLASRALDWLRGRPFSSTDAESPEMFGYLGVRWFGLCIYFAAVMSSCLLVAILLFSAPSAEARVFPTKYDRQIEASAKLWLPGWPWKIWKAQLAAESRLDPNAVSPAGAVGIAQMMPATWLEVTRELRLGNVDRRMADPAIQGGAYYLAKLARMWSSPRPWADRAKLSQASYNAGAGNLLKAQQRCGMPVRYDAIEACLPRITGHYSAETIGYVRRIWAYWARMETGA